MKKHLIFALAILLSNPVYASTDELVNAIKKNDLTLITQLLDNGEDVNGVNSMGNSALHYAVAVGNPDVVKKLLEKGGDVNIKNSKGWSPIMIATQKKNKEIAELLNNSVKPAVKAEVENLAKQIPTTTEVKAEVKEIAIPTPKAEELKDVAVKFVQPEPEIKAEKQVVAERAETPKETSVAEKQVKVVEEAPKVVEEAPKVVEKAVVVGTKAEDKKVETPKVEVKTEKAIETPKPEVKVETKPAQTTSKTETKVNNSPAVKIIKPGIHKVFVPSTMSNKIAKGDEEIVYCLNYLGLQGEQDNMTIASGYFAAENGINQKRHKVIVDIAKEYFENSSTEDIQSRADECAKVITPANKDKQNQIIRSLNKSTGY